MALDSNGLELLNRQPEAHVSVDNMVSILYYSPAVVQPRKPFVQEISRKKIVRCFSALHTFSRTFYPHTSCMYGTCGDLLFGGLQYLYMVLDLAMFFLLMFVVFCSCMTARMQLHFVVHQRSTKDPKPRSQPANVNLLADLSARYMYMLLVLQLYV